MSVSLVIAALALGFAAGVLAGVFGVGGGILFVPTLVALGLTQLEAEATSLLAIVPTALAGVWQQSRFGEIRWRPSLIVGLSSIAGVEVGVQVATRIDEDLLRTLFGVLVLLVAFQLALRALRR